VARKALITFQGWDGKWWKRIKVGKAVYSAATWVMPWKISLALWGVEEVGKVVFRGSVRRAR
jgi:hypothetical protein